MATGGGPNVWRSKVLDAIYGHYKEALAALPPALCPRLLSASVSFGFADPVTNIITNTVVCSDPKPKKRKRPATAREVLSKIVAAGNGLSPPESRTIAERSLVGLLTFLTSYFRHLSPWDALHYLYLSRADLLVAVHLVEADRCYDRRRKDKFCIRSLAVKTALKCAALSASLPNIDEFLTGSYACASHVKLITEISPPAKRCRRLLSGLLRKQPVKLNKSNNDPIDLAVLRLHHHEPDASIQKVPSELTDSLRSVLMDRIHKQYLKAVSRLATKEFRISHHRSLFKAGYCYGPFSSPVSNIIVNTMWYQTAFPALQDFEVDVISTLSHVEFRSLNGLIAFLRVSIPEVSDHDAMVYLLKSNLNIRKAIRMATQGGHDTSGRHESGYKAAADLSYHPKPEAYLEFVVHFLPTVRTAVRSLLQDSQTLSFSKVLGLSRLLSPLGAKSSEPIDDELSKNALERLSNFKTDFLTHQSFVSGKVKAVLRKYEKTVGCCYELCIICGVNDSVGKTTGIRHLKSQYSHANFWAMPKNGNSATIFFAEFSNDEDCKNLQSFCHPVSDLSRHGRCYYCEFKGIRIVHPIEIYWEGANDFEKMAGGEHKITNERIASRGKLEDNMVGIYKEDYIYLDPTQDANLIRVMNRATYMVSLDCVDENGRLRQLDPQQAQ
ncbi:uncharacterized protein LOC100837644 [Brachypodium distachyon]|uniref:Uncharacterized protein n=1 Tax=Brachypodium distachyon TaxID=15368 RepID=I1H453_BRADI|nr:uncharacterized protein LOC100837644 [Brachypodium distachyon]KQK21089.1 hypothetical protein BRADI_1g58660v3 [Brachypodium distachyon]PNT77163.1 hypothetical protein BRADI_1g58660v3 [Brachypodium distachyon]|eukprot:XP_010228432.2 uncharacterized protein LOC100837644 [Brachypodium distachyon]